jgi:hypothetical protein
MGGSSAAPLAATTPHTGRSPLPGQGLDEVRAHPTVKAVLDAFGARVLAVQKMDGDVAPASTPPGVGGGTS